MIPRSRQGAAEAMRRRLVEAAIGQLGDEGMRGLTHRRVENRAGASQGLVKYHFGSLDGLIEAVLQELADIEIEAVIRVTPEQLAEAQAIGDIPGSLWVAAQESWRALNSHPGLTRARYELLLHASTNPQLRPILLRGRQRFVDAVAESLTLAADPQVAARMVIALVEGLVLYQLAAPEETVDDFGPSYIIAGGVAAQMFPLKPVPEPDES